MTNQMTFKRYETKYMLTRPQKAKLISIMKEHMEADCHGRSSILSLYLDTPDFLLVRRSIEKPLYKEKLRIRSYGVADADGIVFLELKKKFNSVVYKRREEMSEKQLEQYLETQVPCKHTQIMRELDYSMHRYGNPSPSILISYEREAFFGTNDSEFRMTFDENILWRDYDLSLCSPIYGTSLLQPGQILLEVKTANAVPLWLVHFLSANNIRSVSFSKYGKAYLTKINKTDGGVYTYE